MRATLFLGVLLSSLMGLSGCEDEAAPPVPTEQNDTCSESDDVHVQLLTAPTDAAVVKKTPAHPPLENGQLP